MKNKDFSYYLSKYLKDYLITERNFSENTLKSYTKTFKLLIEYLVNKKNYKLTDITFSNITQSIIIEFLNYLEEERKNSITTRNQRLAAIKSFYQYCSIEEIENINNINKVLLIKDKKTVKTTVNYLTEDELKRIFNGIDTSTKIGRRDLMLLSLLYDTGARANEIIELKYGDINLETKRIILDGKGKKKRIVSMMEKTKILLIQYLKEFNIGSDDYLFNKNHKKYNGTFVRDIIRKYKDIIPDKNIYPHVFRHTRAVHLLDHGVNIIYIQEFLGHESVITTQIYASVIEDSKFKAIEQATPEYRNENLLDWNDDQDLLNQLLSL